MQFYQISQELSLKYFQLLILCVLGNRDIDKDKRQYQTVLNNVICQMGLSLHSRERLPAPTPFKK